MQGGRGGGRGKGGQGRGGGGMPFGNANNNQMGGGAMQMNTNQQNMMGMPFNQQGMQGMMPFGMPGQIGMPNMGQGMQTQGMPQMQQQPQQQMQQQQQQLQQQQQMNRPGPPGMPPPGGMNIPPPNIPGMPPIHMPGMQQQQGMAGGPRPPQPPFNMPPPQQQQQPQQQHMQPGMGGPMQVMGPPPNQLPQPPQMQLPPPPNMPPQQQQQQGFQGMGMPPPQQQQMQGVIMRPQMAGPGAPRPPPMNMMQQGAAGGPGGGTSALATARGGTGYRAPGTQSAAPNAKEVKNDYCQQFVDTGARPQNYLRDSHLTDRYEEYPKMKELIRMKDQMVADNVTPAYWLKADLRQLKLSKETFGTKFDVILVDPPWEEYVRRAPHAPALKDREVWSWQDIQALEIESIADNPCIIFLWCGAAEGLDAGRHCLQKWGFRRVEDIVWIKTNKERNPRSGYLQPINQEPYSILTHTKEHCLMGMKGSLRRKEDGHVIHANCDTDIIVSEEPAGGSTQKPTEMYEIIERFSLCKRRLELFGEEHNIRDGWVTVGRSLHTTNFRPDMYASHFRYPDGRPYVENVTGGRIPRGAPILIPTPPEVEEARPRSPPDSRGGRR